MSTDQQRPAMTMREIRDRLGHAVPPASIPDPTVQTTGYLVSCLPEDHDERWTFTVRVSYRGDDLWSVQCRSQYVDADGKRSPGFCWSRGPQEPATQAEMDEFDAEQAEWLKAYRFDHVTALRIAKQLAPTLTYRGRSVADVLAVDTNGWPGDEHAEPGTRGWTV